MISWPYFVFRVLPGASSVVLMVTISGGITADMEVLRGIFIAAGEAFPCALEVVIIGMLLAHISFFNPKSLDLLPEHWRMVIALAGC
jgi:hypothetical protein